MKPRTALIIGDAVVITFFVLVGLNNHEGVSLTGWARNAIPFTTSWLVVGSVLGVFRPKIAGSLTSILPRIVLAWPIAAMIGLVARYLILGHGLEVSFIVVTIVTNLVLLLIVRTVYALTRRAAREEANS